MREDIWRLIALALLGLAIGLLVGQPLLCLLIAACTYIVWYMARLRALLLWLRRPKRHPAPEIPGLFESLVGEIEDKRDDYKRKKKRLSRYLKQFKRATSALPDATIVLNEEGVIEWANAAARTILNVHWPQDAHQRISNLIRHPEFIRMLQAVPDSNTSVEIPSPTEPRIHLSIRIVPYGDNQRLFVARDVTRLHELNQIRSDFVANVSHELRTPLTVIRGYLETITDGEPVDADHFMPQLEQMQTQTQRMQHIVDELLLLSRLEQTEGQTLQAAVMVSEMLGKIQAQAQALSGEAQHLFYIEAEPELMILGNANELYSAFANLVFNAVQYTPARGSIRIRWYHDDAGAHLLVRDTGIGIPRHHIPRLTERFYRVDSSRSRDKGGTGLGLAIVKHVLNRHEASLNIVSEQGQGSSFRCDFPPTRILVTEKPERDEEAG